MFEFIPANSIGNIETVKYRGINLGRIMLKRGQDKRAKNKLFVIVDRDRLEVIPKSQLWHRLGQPMNREQCAKLMLHHRKVRRV